MLWNARHLRGGRLFNTTQKGQNVDFLDLKPLIPSVLMPRCKTVSQSKRWRLSSTTVFNRSLKFRTLKQSPFSLCCLGTSLCGTKFGVGKTVLKTASKSWTALSGSLCVTTNFRISWWKYSIDCRDPINSGSSCMSELSDLASGDTLTSVMVDSWKLKLWNSPKRNGVEHLIFARMSFSLVLVWDESLGSNIKSPSVKIAEASETIFQTKTNSSPNRHRSSQ